MDHMGLHINEYVDVSINIAKNNKNMILGTTGMNLYKKIREAVDIIGASRLIFGSNAPLIHPACQKTKIKVAV